MSHSIPKGLFDILPSDLKAEDKWREVHLWQYLENVLKKTAFDYAFEEIRTPIFESTDLFTRGVGDSSDIVTKEMYTFLDKSDRSLTLRPEGTASVMRAFIENQMYQAKKTHKLFYIGPMFRYERPQAGRYRQHHQFGAEAIGSSSPYQDVEIIDMLCEIYRRLGLSNLTVLINSVGNMETRDRYKNALHDYLQEHEKDLSKDSQVRFQKNILRILDSKDPKDKQILQEAPCILDFLESSAKDHFDLVCSLLSKEKIPYKIDHKLVRGLDYYNHTVFEVVCDELGAQNTVGAGGRYDGLIHDLGGPDIPSVGFATGMERILQTMIKQNVKLPKKNHPFLYLIGIDKTAFDTCFHLLTKLHRQQIPAQMDFSGKKLSICLQNADQSCAEYTVVLGETEIQTNSLKLKHMASRKEESVTLSDLTSFIQKLWFKQGETFRENA